MSEDLTPAGATLLAAHLTATANIPAFRILASQYTTVFTPSHILQILLISLPETTNPSLYTDFVREVVTGSLITSSTSNAPVDTTSISTINDRQALRSLHEIGLKSKPQPIHEGEDILTPWLFSRVRNIDSETGIISIADNLLGAFIESSPEIYGWYTGTIQVLSKLIYGHPDADGHYGLSQFEELDTRSGIRILLSRATPDTASRDLEELVVPYIRYRRRKVLEEGLPDPWSWVWEWLVGRSKGAFRVVVAVVSEWDGPEEEELMADYARAAMTACYLCGETAPGALQGILIVIRRIGDLLRIQSDGSVPVDELLFQASTQILERRDVFTSARLLEPTFILTTPSPASLYLLESLIKSVEIIGPLLRDFSISSIAAVRVRDNKDEQSTLLTRLLRSENWLKRADDDWKRLRGGLKWLNTSSRLLGKLTEQEIDLEILKSLLTATKFALVSEIFVRGRKPLPLPKEVVETAVLHAVLYEFYDNATNGNKTRGSMKNASAALAILYPNVSQSIALTRASRLIDATHQLSNYSLTLTPGVPLKPVQVRTYPDPPELISRVLQSNSKTYTQLDSLLVIVRDLVYGTGAGEEQPPLKPSPELTARITGMCVESALAEDDFETAYSLIMNRLIRSTTPTNTNDTAWRAAFQAGRYRPAYLIESTNTLSLRQLEMRMELLSQALLICPSTAMMEVLNLWRRLEEELNELLEKEVEEEEEHAAKLTWPGGFPSSSPAVRKQNYTATSTDTTAAPMSLFAVAASATRVAKALGSNLRAPTPLAGGVSARSSGEFDRDGGEEGRVRRRDALSNMVTGGLASGLGWVIGANPAHAAGGDGQGR